MLNNIAFKSSADKNFIRHYFDIYHNDNNFLVEFEDSDEAGILHLHRFCNSSGQHGGYLYGLYTQKQYRCKGIGRGLVSDAIATLYCDGYDYAVLVPKDMETKEWFQKIGFRVLDDKRIQILGFDGLDLTIGKSKDLPAMYYPLNSDLKDITLDPIITINKGE